MTRFAINQPITTEQPTVVVDAGLPAGTHRFRLVVVDDSGLSSRPDELAIQVLPPGVGIVGRLSAVLRTVQSALFARPAPPTAPPAGPPFGPPRPIDPRRP